MSIDQMIALCTQLHDADTTSIDQAFYIDQIRYSLELIQANEICGECGKRIRTREGHIDPLCECKSNSATALVRQGDLKADVLLAEIGQIKIEVLFYLQGKLDNKWHNIWAYKSYYDTVDRMNGDYLSNIKGIEFRIIRVCKKLEQATIVYSK